MTASRNNPRSLPVVGRIWLAERDHHSSLTRLTLGASAAAVLLLVAGVPAIDLHGPLHHLGVMDPLCGGTRAMFLLLTGHPGQAATYNPVVFPLTAAGVVLLLRAAAGWSTRRWLTIQLTAPGRRILILLGLAAVAAVAVRQQLHADLLTQAWP